MRFAVKISGWDHARLKLRHYRRNPLAWRQIYMYDAVLRSGTD
jgi:hypothetical protein